EAARGGSSWLALVFGGLVAGALGFFGANLTPDPPPPEFDTTALSSGISANAEVISELSGAVERLQDGADIPDFGSQITALSENLAALT
ncbi:MAG: hypothetical protein AAGL19_00275, partial [Pseudomonadota bacterium]